MASIQQRPDGRWWARIHRRGVEVSKIFRTKRLAERWAREVETAIEDGTYQRPVNLTLAQALDKYVSEVSPRKRPRTAKEEQYKAGIIKRHRIARRPLSEIRPVDVVQYRDDRLKVVGVNAVRLELALISALYNTAKAEWGLQVENPVVRGVRPSTKGTARERRITEDELSALLHVADDLGWHDIADAILFALETGMRRGEISAITRDMVDADRRIIRLKASQTKTARARTVPLPPAAWKIIKRRMDSVDGDRLFPHEITISHRFRDLCKYAGVQDLHFHDLRHEALSRMYERGELSMQEIMMISGHTSPQIHMRYVHLAAAKIAAKMWEGETEESS